MYDNNRLGPALRQRRIQLGLTLDQLSEMTALHKSYLSRLESGIVTRPSTDSLQRIAAGLGLTETDVFGLLDAETRSKLPRLQPYLRAKYDLSDDAIREITDYFAQRGIATSGPLDGEDER